MTASGLKGAVGIGKHIRQTQFSILGIVPFTNKDRFGKQQTV